MMRVDAALAIVRIFLRGTPGCFVHKHVKDEAVLVQVQALEIVVQVKAIDKAIRHEVILNAFILEVQVYVRNCLKVLKTEARELVGLLAAVEGDN